MLFNLQYARCLLAARHELSIDGLLLQASYVEDAQPWAAEANGASVPYEVCDSTYVDDEAIYIFSADPWQLVGKVQRALAIIHSCFLTHAMEINWSPGKSEVLLSFRGEDSRAARRAVKDAGSRITFATSTGEQLNILAVEQYKHVGTMIAANGLPNIDIAERVKKASAVYGAMSKKVFGSKRVSWQLKLSLFNSLAHW